MTVSTGYITRLATGGGGSEEQWTNKIGVLELVGSAEASLLNNSAVSISDIEDWGRSTYYEHVTETADFVTEGIRCWTQRKIVDLDEEENPIYSQYNARINLQLIVDNEFSILKPNPLYLSFYGGIFYGEEGGDSFSLSIEVFDENDNSIGSAEISKDLSDNAPWNEEITIPLDYDWAGSLEMKKIRLSNTYVAN